MQFKLKTFTTKYLSASAAFILFIIAFSVGSIMYTGFATRQNFLNLFIDNAFLLVSATGMTLVILSGGIDLSVGSILAFTTMIISGLTELGHMSAIPAILIALAVGTLLGFLMGCMIAFWNVPPFIATLAGMFFARGACYLISIRSITISNEFLKNISLWKFHFGDSVSSPFISVNVIIALLIVIAGFIISLYTKFGRNIYAIGGNEQSAILLGIPVKKTKVLVYTFNGFCSAMAGVVFTLYMLSGYGLHCQGMEMDVIAAVVIGGTLLIGGVGYIAGTVFGVLTLGIIQTLIMFDGTISSWWTKITVGVLLLIFIVLQRVIISVGSMKKASADSPKKTS